MGLWRLMDDWNVFFCFTWARWRFLFYRSPINKHKDSAETWRRISRSSGSATDKQNGRPRLSNNEPRLDPWQLYSKQIPYFTLIAFAPLSLCLRQKRIIQKSPNSPLAADTPATFRKKKWNTFLFEFYSIAYRSIALVSLYLKSIEPNNMRPSIPSVFVYLRPNNSINRVATKLVK